jgi:hypothetical protein
MLRKEIYESPQFVLVLSTKFIFSLLTRLDVRTRRVPSSDMRSRTIGPLGQGQFWQVCLHMAATLPDSG